MSRLVSIIVPTYNRAYCLARTLDSALAQTHRELEVLVVDDGSRDATRDLMQSRYGQEPRVKYLYRDNGGVSAARNTGLRAAQGDYIALLDSDDVWRPWKLQAQLACLDFLPQAGMIWSDMEAVDSEGTVIYSTYLRRMYDAYHWFGSDELFQSSYPLDRIVPALRELAGGTLWCGDIFPAMLMGNLVHTSTVLLRRERWEKVGFFDETLKIAGEDHDFHFRTCREGPVALLDRSSIRYQLGLSDRLSQHSQMVAVNFLQTVQKRLANDRERITLPPWMVRQVLARAHRWVGTELQDAGDMRGARPHLWTSLKLKPWQPRVAALLALSLLPRVVDQTLRRGYRWLKGPAAEGLPRNVTDCPPPSRQVPVVPRAAAEPVETAQVEKVST